MESTNGSTISDAVETCSYVFFCGGVGRCVGGWVLFVATLIGMSLGVRFGGLRG